MHFEDGRFCWLSICELSEVRGPWVKHGVGVRLILEGSILLWLEWLEECGVKKRVEGSRFSWLGPLEEHGVRGRAECGRFC